MNATCSCLLPVSYGQGGFPNHLSIILNTLLIVALGVLAIGALLTYLFREPLGRARRYFVAWSEHDQRRAEEAHADAALRERAEAELHREIHGPHSDAGTAYDLNELKRNS